MGKPGKRKGQVMREQPNLKRCRNMVNELMQTAGDTSHTHASLAPPKVSRKERRKQARAVKKMRNLAFHQRKPLPTLESLEKEKKEKEAVENAKKQAAKKKERNRKRKEKKRQKQEKAEEERQAQLAEEMKADDRAIHQLERQLKLNKRKRKTLPASFVNDGLDYLLDVLDPEKKDILYNLQDDGEEEEEESQGDDFEEEEEFGSEEEEEGESEEEGEEEDSDEEEMSEDDGSEEESAEDEFTGSGDEDAAADIDDDDDDDDEVEEEEEEEEDVTPKEDIYGRLVDKKGKQVKFMENKPGAYVPPGKLLAMKGADQDDVQNMRMQRRLKGLLNRLSAATLPGVSSQVEGIYREGSRAHITHTLVDQVLVSCMQTDQLPEKILAEQALLLAVLHSNVGTEVGAMMLQMWAKNFDEILYKNEVYGEGKQMENMVVFISHLYNFKVAHSCLIFDIMSKFTEKFTPRDIDLLLVLLKNVGVQLRKDEPEGLRSAIVDIQNRAGKLTTETSMSRVKFMLEILMAIRNNNFRKIPNYDPDLTEGLIKLLRPLVGSAGGSQAALRVGLSEMLEAGEKGRWWLVGSAWSGPGPAAEDTTGDSQALSIKSKGNETLMKLAQKLRMNTDIRRNLFCLIMNSEDFVDAFERILQLGLARRQEAEIIHVVLEICLQEATFNPFYAYLVQKLCEYDRRFKMLVQTSVSDRISGGQTLTTQQTQNLAKFLVHLIINNASSLALFKVLEFGALEKTQVRLLKCLLRHLLLDQSPDNVHETFLRISSSPKLQRLREGLQLFMHHFLLRGKQEKLGGDKEALRERVNIAEKGLKSGHGRMVL